MPSKLWLIQLWNAFFLYFDFNYFKTWFAKCKTYFCNLFFLNMICSHYRCIVLESIFFSFSCIIMFFCSSVYKQINVVIYFIWIVLLTASWSSLQAWLAAYLLTIWELQAFQVIFAPHDQQITTGISSIQSF